MCEITLFPIPGCFHRGNLINILGLNEEKNRVHPYFPGCLNMEGHNAERDTHIWISTNMPPLATRWRLFTLNSRALVGRPWFQVETSPKQSCINMPSSSFLLAPHTSWNCLALPSCPQPSLKHLNRPSLCVYLFSTLIPSPQIFQMYTLASSLILPLPNCLLTVPIDFKWRRWVSFWQWNQNKNPTLPASSDPSSHWPDWVSSSTPCYPSIPQSCFTHVYLLCQWGASPHPGLLLTSPVTS